MKTKYYTSLAGIVGISLLLAACGTEEAVQQEQNVTIVQTQDETVGTSDTETTEKYKSHIEEQLCDHVKVDANVHIPTDFNYEQEAIGKGKLGNFDSDKVKELLMKDTKSVETAEEDGELFYEGEDGSYLDVYPMEGYISYYTAQASYIEQTLRYGEGISSNNLDRYSQEEDLPFETRTDVIHNIRSQMKEIGIDLGENYKCYALDHETMEEEEIAYDNIGEASEEAKKVEWTQEDDCYYIVFDMECEGRPLYMDGYGDFEDGKGMDQSEISFIYSKNGFEEITIMNYYAIEDVGENISVITLEDALEALKSKYDSVILTTDITIKDIRLQYVPVYETKNSCTIEPVWVFMTSDRKSVV